MGRAGKPTSARALAMLVVVIAAALLLRLLPVNYGAPQPGYFSSDEIDAVSRALKLGTGDLMPIHANKPTLYNLVVAGCYGVEYAISRSLRGTSKEDFERAFFVDPFGFYRTARGVSIAASIAALGLMLFFLRAHAPRVRLGALLLLGVAPSSVYYGHVAKEDALAAMLAYACFGFAAEALRGLQNAGDHASARRWLGASALSAGLAVSTKYNCFFCAAFPLIACWMTCSSGWKRARSMSLVFALMGIAFVIGTPYALLHPASFLHRTLGSAVASQVTGAYNILSYAGNRGPGFAGAIIWREFGPALPALVAGLICLAWQKDAQRWLLLPPTLVYLVTLVASNQLDYQYAIVVTPVIIHGAATAWSRIRQSKEMASVAHVRHAVLVAIALVCLACAGNLVRVARQTAEFLGGDTRLVAGEWLAAEAEQGRLGTKPLLVATGYYFHYYPALRFDAATYRELREYARSTGSEGNYFRRAEEYAGKGAEPLFRARFLDLRTGFQRMGDGTRTFDPQPFALDVKDYEGKYSLVILPGQTLRLLTQPAPELDELQRFVGQLADLPLVKSFEPVPWRLAGPEIRIVRAP